MNGKKIWDLWQKVRSLVNTNVISVWSLRKAFVWLQRIQCTRHMDYLYLLSFLELDVKKEQLKHVSLKKIILEWLVWLKSCVEQFIIRSVWSGRVQESMAKARGHGQSCWGWKFSPPGGSSSFLLLSDAVLSSPGLWAVEHSPRRGL